MDSNTEAASRKYPVTDEVREAMAVIRRGTDTLLIESELEQKLAAIREGAGLARRMAEEMGIHLSDEPIDYKALRDEMYDEMIFEMEERHV